MSLINAQEGKSYIIDNITTSDEELNSFLFSLGCYKGETITLISHLKSGCIVSIKDGRYSIDKALADAINVAA
ncbi:MAG: ferrous iron transport protein A [Clostridiales bacterium]|jgi:ferrous iron transport protein A|nr:ferrous iron transport protein A [Clostridiales bacterium]